MKALLTFIAVLSIVASASAQFVQGPVIKSVLTNLTTLAIPPADGATTAATNITSYSTPNWIPVGKDGFAIAIKSYGTNAALTTNVWWLFETSHNGVDPNTNATFTVVQLPQGVATNTYFTNFVLSTSAVYGNIAAIRLQKVTQTNGLVGSSVAGRLFIEKFNVITR